MTHSDIEERVCLLMLDVSWDEETAFRIMDLLEEGRLHRAMAEVSLLIEQQGCGDADELEELVNAWRSNPPLG